MDKNQFDQLKKLVMDLDKSLTRLKSFIDQHESEPGFDTFNDDFGFPPLPSRRPAPLGARPSASPSARPSPFDNVMQTPLKSPDQPSATSSSARPPFSPGLTGASAPRPVPPPIPTQDFNVTRTAPPVSQTPPKAVPNAPSTNTVLSPNSAGVITEEMEGTFDGQYLVSSSGQKVEVPANYASKSRILYGDMVKAYKENGEQKFKVTTKQPRKKIKAMTVKREGKWFVVTGVGSYKIADATADFNNLQVNQEVNVLVPENNATVPFAAFDEVVSNEQQKSVQPAQPVQPTNSSTHTPAQPPRPSTGQGQAQPQQYRNNQSEQQRQAPRDTRNDRNDRNDKNFKPRNPVPNQQQPSPQQSPAPAPSATVDPALKVVEDFDLV